MTNIVAVRRQMVNTMYNVKLAVNTQLNLLYYMYNVYTTKCFGLF